MRTARWIASIPLGFLASIVVGGICRWVAELFGGDSWYLWMVSGLASAFAFFWTAFRIAPERTRVLKWALVAIVGTLGAMAAAGPLIVQREPISAFSGVAMMFIAFMYSRMSVAQIETDLAQTTR